MRFSSYAYATTYLILVTLIVGLISLVALSYFPFNPLTPSFSNKVKVSTVLTQGWAFFTKTPHEEIAYLYEKKNNKWYLLPMNNASANNLFGLSRLDRKRQAEISYILSQAKHSDKWSNAQDEGVKLHINRNHIEVKNIYYSPLVKGEFMLKLEKPLKWAWRNIPNLKRNYRFIRIVVI